MDEILANGLHRELRELSERADPVIVASGRSEAKQIRVRVADYGRKFLYMRYRDPITGKMHARSTGTANRLEAEIEAERWQSELLSPDVGWDQLCALYENEVLSNGAASTRRKHATVKLFVQAFISPRNASDLTTRKLAIYVSERVRRGRSEGTAATDIGHIAAMLRWAHVNGLISRLPVFPVVDSRCKAGSFRKPKGAKFSREEAIRLCKAVDEARAEAETSRTEAAVREFRKREKDLAAWAVTGGLAAILETPQ